MLTDGVGQGACGCSANRQAREEMARERALGLNQMATNAGLDQMSAVLSGYQPEGAHRLFTRQEVLAVLKARKAMTGPRDASPEDGAIVELMEELILIFERME